MGLPAISFLRGTRFKRKKRASPGVLRRAGGGALGSPGDFHVTLPRRLLTLCVCAALFAPAPQLFDLAMGRCLPGAHVYDVATGERGVVLEGMPEDWSGPEFIYGTEGFLWVRFQSGVVTLCRPEAVKRRW